MYKLQSILIALVLSVLQQELSIPVSAQEVHFKEGVPHVILANGGLVSGNVSISRDGRPYSSFTGIPFATIPERFKEARPITEPSWQGIFSATQAGPMCPQMSFYSDSEQDPDIVGKEECLNINVFVPMLNKTGEKDLLVVMVWVHGGGYMFGSGVNFPPPFFMDEDVILVSFNYRLGAFGFLSTGDTVIPGNNGMKDQVLALKWVQENIKQFGGDPGKVTIFGESAGGASVHHLLLSSKTKGLFRGAISQSGSALCQWAYYPNPKQEAVKLATYLNCTTTASEPSGITSDEIFTCLKEMPMEQLAQAQFEYKTSWPSNLRSYYFAPTVEPSNPVTDLSPFQSEPPISILTRKDSSLQEVPWIVGATEDEGATMYAGVVLGDPDRLQEINEDWDNVAPQVFDYENYLPGQDEVNQVSEKVKQFYFGKKEISAETRVPLTNAFSDEMILHGVFRSAMETASRGEKNPVYLYQYAYKGPMSLMGLAHGVTGVDAEKVSHADDLQHLFDFGNLGTDDDNEFSRNFVRLWASFAIHGKPKSSWGNGTLTDWKPISKKELDGTEPLKWFRIDSNATTCEIDKPVQDRMTFWDSLWSQHLTSSVMAQYQCMSQTEKNITGTGA